MRFAPTMKEVAEAATRLPNPYTVQANGPVTRYRVAHCVPWSPSKYDLTFTDDLFPVFDFEIDVSTDAYGAVWKRWVYKGLVQV